MRPRLVPRIRDIAAAEWDALHAAPYPFARHAFLAALEEHGCVGGDTGWEPGHLVLEDADGTLAGAAPLYRKQHSYGEFVFDFAWADAAYRAGVPYYPKLLCAIPFTPVTGPRFAARSADAQELLLTQLDRIVGDDGLSSAHALFLDAADAAAAATAGWLERHDVQFHWHARGAASFEEFLARLSHDKRKKIRRERRKVAEAGITFEWRAGPELSESEWAEVYTLYGNTYEERGQAPYLTRAFFLDYGRRAESPLRLILARDGTRLIAVAVTLVGGDTLYGRHWGCAARYDGLHFETCYYQGIELCLAEGLAHFDAGAQGAHKLARGFEPTVTRSAHRLADARLARAIGAFLERERALVAQRQSLLAEHSPYRDEAAAHDG
jgi:predicted N-acyltransferase